MHIYTNLNKPVGDTSIPGMASETTSKQYINKEPEAGSNQ